MSSETFSVIIPTLDRPRDLERCVRSVGKQTKRPVEVIIVDDGSLPSELIDRFREILSDDTALVVTESDGPMGISTARNTGIELADGSVCLLLDDDVILSDGYLERLCSIYDSIGDRTLAGIGGFDRRLRSLSGVERLFNNLFGLGSDGWMISAAGIQSWDSTVTEPTRAEWLSGNNASYRTELVKKYSFRHWNGGRETLEDVALGWELQKHGYYCIIDPELGVKHADTGIDDSPFGFGVKRARNRIRIFREFGDQSDIPIAIWAFVGDTLRHVIAPIIDQRIFYHWLVAAGMISGFLSQVVGR